MPRAAISSMFFCEPSNLVTKKLKGRQRAPGNSMVSGRSGAVRTSACRENFKLGLVASALQQLIDVRCAWFSRALRLDRLYAILQIM